MFHYSVGVFLVLFSLYVIKSESATFPNDIQKCKRTDSQCILDRMNEILEKYPHGYPPFNIPDLEQMHFDSFSNNQNGGKNDLKITAKDLNVEGVSQHRVAQLKGFDGFGNKSTVVEITSYNPKVTITGKYEISGKLLIFPIEGSGDFKIELINTTYTTKMKLSTKLKDGKLYGNISKYQIKTSVEKLIMRLDNLFNGDKALGDNLNQVLNENWTVLWDELAPDYDKNTSALFKKIVGGFLDTFPIDEMFLPDE